MTLHNLGIGLATSFRVARSAALAPELESHAIDTRSEMLDRSELDLELGLGRDSMLRKYLEDEIHTIPDRDFLLSFCKKIFDMVHLSTLEMIADDDQLDRELISEYRDLLKLA